jgi:Ca2+:H+ antiporter
MNRVQSGNSVNNRPTASHQSSGATTIGPEAEHGEATPVMSRTAAVVMLCISTALVAVCADFMSDAIEPMVEHTNVSAAFIGLIILPIVGNAAEHVTAVTVAAKNKMDLAIGVAVGSSIQIGMFYISSLLSMVFADEFMQLSSSRPSSSSWPGSWIKTCLSTSTSSRR